MGHRSSFFGVGHGAEVLIALVVVVGAALGVDRNAFLQSALATPGKTHLHTQTSLQPDVGSTSRNLSTTKLLRAQNTGHLASSLGGRHASVEDTSLSVVASGVEVVSWLLVDKRSVTVELGGEAVVLLGKDDRDTLSKLTCPLFDERDGTSSAMAHCRPKYGAPEGGVRVTITSSIPPCVPFGSPKKADSRATPVSASKRAMVASGRLSKSARHPAFAMRTTVSPARNVHSATACVAVPPFRMNSIFRWGSGNSGYCSRVAM